jgi:predicted ester cyclase
MRVCVASVVVAMMTFKRKSLISKILMVLTAGVTLNGHVPLTLANPQQNDIRAASPQVLIVAGDMHADRRDAMLASARRFYLFWNTGDEMLLRQAISENFVDHTLPPGRPQGPAGPAAAAKAFLAAIPDLKVVVSQQMLVGDRVVSHLRFTGHFTGQFNSTKGVGQPVDFIATDILAVHDDRITDNWHLEDNLTFLQQIGLIPR